MNPQLPRHNLPDPFLFTDGTRVATAADWRRRRQELLGQVLDIAYGRLPPAPAWVRGELLHSHDVTRFDNAQHCQYRLTTGPSPAVSFILDLMIPPKGGPFGVILNGDGCWRYVTDAITTAVLSRGYVLATFNRVELAIDTDNRARDTGLYAAWPDGDYGALAAWAWGYHRCVDFLLTRRNIRADQVAVTGHSRGGKVVLLAGVTDERIAVTAPNNSGCGGAGCFRWRGADSEALSDILRAFPNWFSPRLQAYVGREQDLPFDLHSVKALVAPRALLCTEALGDAWANPSGTWQSHRAAAEVYRFLGAESRIATRFRPGGHAHNEADWRLLLDFCDAQFANRPFPEPAIAPFADLPPAFTWSAPRRESTSA